MRRYPIFNIRCDVARACARREQLSHTQCVQRVHIAIWNNTPTRQQHIVHTLLFHQSQNPRKHCVVCSRQYAHANRVNIFLQSPMIMFVISGLGVLIFSGLIAFDTQRLKMTYYSLGGDQAAMGVATPSRSLTLLATTSTRQSSSAASVACGSAVKVVGPPLSVS